MTEEEIRAKSLEIAALAYGKEFSTLFRRMTVDEAAKPDNIFHFLKTIEGLYPQS
jgi:hypothetical protein